MRFCRTDRRSAFTLLEVVVGLLLMATILVGSLLSFSAHRKQRRVAEAKIQAVAIADELLNLFFVSPDGIPASGRGAIEGQPNWFWQTGLVGTTNPANVPMQVIRFQIVEVTEDRSTRPLVTVDLVEPIES